MNELFRHEWLLINPYFVNRYYSYRVSQPLSGHARLCCFSCDVRKSVALYVSLEVYCLSSSNGHLLESLWRFLDSLISLGTCNGQFKNQSCECTVPDYRFFWNHSSQRLLPCYIRLLEANAYYWNHTVSSSYIAGKCGVVNGSNQEAIGEFLTCWNLQVLPRESRTRV